jgi:hypothetical protein
MVTENQKLGMWNSLRAWWNTKNVSARDLIMQNRVVAGLHLGLLLEQHPSRIEAAMHHLFKLYDEGKIKPHIDSIWPLDKVHYFSRSGFNSRGVHIGFLINRLALGQIILYFSSTNHYFTDVSYSFISALEAVQLAFSALWLQFNL